LLPLLRATAAKDDDEEEAVGKELQFVDEEVE